MLALGGFTTIALPDIISQTRKLLMNLPYLVESVVPNEELRRSLSTELSKLTFSQGGVVSFTVNFFSNAITTVTLFIFTLYLSIDLPNVKKRFIELFGEKHKSRLDESWHEIEVNLSRWIKGQLFLMVAVGLAAYVGLVFLKIPYAVPLAIISGLLEVVPVLGPIIATIVAGVVGFSIDPLTGTMVVALFVGIQQLENTILVPRIMQKVIGFNPLVTMMALLIGGQLFGIIGALIAVPTILILIVITHSIISIEVDDTGLE